MKLPDIMYGRAVETLGRYGSNAPSIIRQSGQKVAGAMRAAGETEARGIAESSKILGQSITSAGATLARGELQAEKDKNDLLAKREIGLARLEIEDDASRRQVTVGIIRSVADIAVQSAVKWAAASQQSKVDSASVAAGTEMATFTQELTSSNKIDLNSPAYSGLDTSGLESTSMINENGSVSRWANTHDVSGALLEQKMMQQRGQALSGVSEGPYREALEMKLDVLQGETYLKLNTANNKYAHADLKATYSNSVNIALRSGQYDKAQELVINAETMGVYSGGEANKALTGILDTKQYDEFSAMTESLKLSPEGIVPTENVAKIRSAIHKANNVHEKALLSDLRSTENRLESQSKLATAEYDKIKLQRFLVEDATDVGGLTHQDLTGKGTTRSQYQDSVVTQAKEQGLEESLVTVRLHAGAAYDRAKQEIQTIEMAGMTDWNKKMAEDPDFTGPPPYMEGMNPKVQASAAKLHEARVKGLDVVTDRFKYNTLMRTATDDPKNYPNHKQLETEWQGHLSPQDYDNAVSVGQKLLSNESKPLGQAAVVNRTIDDFAKAIYGRGFEKKKTKFKMAIEAEYWARDLVSGLPAGSTQQDIETVIRSVYNSEAILPKAGSSEGKFNTTSEKKLVESRMMEFASELRYTLKKKGLAPTSKNMLNLYRYKVETGGIVL